MNSHAPVQDADIRSFDTFCQIVGQTIDPATVPKASDILRNIPIYDGAKVESADRPVNLREWAQVLLSGAGIIVIRQGLPDHRAIDRASHIFEQIIAGEKAAQKGGGDHFARPGANDRI